jgi:hypothetical protein
LDAQAEIKSVELPWCNCVSSLNSAYCLIGKAPPHVVGSVNIESQRRSPRTLSIFLNEDWRELKFGVNQPKGNGGRLSN